MSEKLPRSVYVRRRLLVTAGALCTAGAVYFGGNQIVDALDSYDDPTPANCEVTIGGGETAWGIAGQIGEHHPDKATGEIVFDIERANPGEEVGSLQPGDVLGVPEQYCDAIVIHGIGR